MMIKCAGEVRCLIVPGHEREPEDLRVVGNLSFDVGCFEAGVCDPAYPNHGLLLCGLPCLKHHRSGVREDQHAATGPHVGRPESTSIMIATSCSPKPMSMQRLNNSAARSRMGVATPALAANASTVSGQCQSALAVPWAGRKRRSTIHGARMRNCVEAPLPPAIALIIRSTSTPALRPSAIASAVAAMCTATSRLLTSFT